VRDQKRLLYVPARSGQQRGAARRRKVGTRGKPLWTGLIASFPGLSTRCTAVTSQRRWRRGGQVDVEGTQQLAGPHRSGGQHYRGRPGFISTSAPTCSSKAATAYWNDEGRSQQLGHTEVGMTRRTHDGTAPSGRVEGLRPDVDWSTATSTTKPSNPSGTRANGQGAPAGLASMEEDTKSQLPGVTCGPAGKEAAGTRFKAALQRSSRVRQPERGLEVRDQDALRRSPVEYAAVWRARWPAFG